MNLFKKLTNDHSLYCGLLKLDLDTAAERIVVLDRLSGYPLWVSLVQHHTFGGLMNVIVPTEYTNNQKIMVMIMDDDTTYNMAGLDKIQPDLVNMATLEP